MPRADTRQRPRAALPDAVFDPARLAAVRESALLDTEPEEAFDDLASLAASVAGTGRAFVSLVDDRRSFLKSAVGPGMQNPAGRDIPVRDALCPLVIAAGHSLAVQDTGADPRTRDHPAVRSMKIGAWAAHPVVAPGGEVLGTFCVIDENRHDWTPGELGALATVARAVNNELRLRSTIRASRELAERATALARSLQESLLPPALSEVPGMETAASYLPAAGGSEVTGDFYDLFLGQGGWWCTVMGDVCGTGVEAAKITALARYTLRAEGSQHRSPAQVLARLNRALLEQSDEDRFLTAVYATFHKTATGFTGRLSSGGHPPALIRRADGRIQAVGAPGTLLGAFARIDLAEARFRLAPGDALVFYTDGAIEARAARSGGGHGPLFGETALARTLASCHDARASTIVERVGSALARHTGGWASDDTALLAL
ncbi:MAG TPA: GAF domain-containing SpoIIE family protein phosphatase, partial [Actinospica sp.]|nr:GAF domain-containing SpoIIE family protein phosphatase [Actinospica sp.]